MFITLINEAQKVKLTFRAFQNMVHGVVLILLSPQSAAFFHSTVL